MIFPAIVSCVIMVVIMSAFNGCRANTTLTGEKCVFYVFNEYFLSLLFFLLFYAYCVALTHTCTALATAGDPFVHCVYVRASSYPYMHSPDTPCAPCAPALFFSRYTVIYVMYAVYLSSPVTPIVGNRVSVSCRFITYTAVLRTAEKTLAFRLLLLSSAVSCSPLVRGAISGLVH